MNNLFLLQIKLNQIQAGLIFGAILGFLLGLIPLILGIIKRKIKLGVAGFVGSIIGNAALGLILSVPIIAFCVYLILKNPTSAVVSEPEIPAGNSEIL